MYHRYPPETALRLAWQPEPWIQLQITWGYWTSAKTGVENVGGKLWNGSLVKQKWDLRFVKSNQLNKDSESWQQRFTSFEYPFLNSSNHLKESIYSCLSLIPKWLLLNSGSWPFLLASTLDSTLMQMRKNSCKWEMKLWAFFCDNKNKAREKKLYPAELLTLEKNTLKKWKNWADSNDCLLGLFTKMVSRVPILMWEQQAHVAMAVQYRCSSKLALPESFKGSFWYVSS